MMAVLRSGGNQFHGRYEGSYQGTNLQSNNLTSELGRRGRATRSRSSTLV